MSGKRGKCEEECGPGFSKYPWDSWITPDSSGYQDVNEFLILIPA